LFAEARQQTRTPTPNPNPNPNPSPQGGGERTECVAPFWIDNNTTNLKNEEETQ